MPLKTVIEPPAAGAGKAQEPDPSLEGEIASKELENKLREKLRGEYSRKEVEMAKHLSEAQARLEELDEKVRLSEAEKKERARLNSTVDSLESRLNVFKSDPQFDAARAYIDEKLAEMSDKTALRVKSEIYSELVDEFIEENAETAKLTPSEFRDELKKHLRAHHMEMTPTKRTKQAYKLYLKEIESSKKEKELLDKELKLNQFSETGEKIARETTYDEAKQKGDLKEMAKHLGL